MKVLFCVGYPLGMARGGHAVQIRESAKALVASGVEVEWVDFHSPTMQRADIVHYWSMPGSLTMWNTVRSHGMKQVVSVLLPQGLLNRTLKSAGLRLLCKSLETTLGTHRLFGRFGLGVMSTCDAAIFTNQADLNYARWVYGLPEHCGHVVPNGVADVFFDPTVPPDAFDGLLYPSFISPRKNQVEVARAARATGVRVRFVGGAASAESAYVNTFRGEVDSQYVFWDDTITDARRMAAAYRGARGTVLASDADNQPLVLLESLACGRPVLAPDLVPVRGYFGDRINYCSSARTSGFAAELKRFDAYCRSGKQQTVEVLRWTEVGASIARIYESLLGGRP